jgi:hypothetical protein
MDRDFGLQRVYGFRGLPNRHDGLGAIGPLGNASSIAAGKYKITGTDVFFRRGLVEGLPPTGTMLTIGDEFTATGEVKGVNNASGTYINFAKGNSKFGEGWVAVQYLAPAESFNPVTYQPGGGGGGGGGIQPVKTTSVTTITETSWFEDNWMYIAGAAALGVVGYALFSKGKGSKKKR